MSSIKLTADSGGGTFEIKAPSSSGNTRVLTLPDTGNITLHGGKILQVQSLTKDTANSTNSSSYVDTGLTVTLTTPQSGSKVLITCDLQFGAQNNSYGAFQLLRDSTAIGRGTQATGNSINVTFGAGSGQDNDQYRVRTVSYSILDTHGADGSTNVTYKLQWASVYQSYYIYLNRPNNVDNQSYNMFGSSTITAMEIAA
tara:strand:+ start:227 stop:823 length:597 start_codon:yes stop_codon:yes gene_type:complete